MTRHQLTYIDMHPQPIEHVRPWVAYLVFGATLAVFALIGVLLAWRG